MATLIPSLNSCLGRMTSGEKRFAYRLEKLLEDDYLCWYDVTVGVKRRRPDFLVLNPQRGLLALEVKDWKIGSIRGIDPITIEAEFNGQIVKDVNPLLKARDFINVTIDLLKRDPLLLQAPDSRYTGKLVMPYGHGLVLANNASHDPNEQARVLYVGMTRAMNRLWLTTSKDSDFAQKAQLACTRLAA
ncbi:nuclease-related domain-containing protein [Chitinimonas taiwanensis]|uniref:Nuclease-related domain-containing protein n=1 Tax=Chitinimonas taiwanensis DSM 18899 TaxID=1121279 RepID=A0A1K2HSL7_9NEIS|nr:nuclease-related domain-containing protein [Chitinimonas taiwanensis]SFZ79553.1 Nuclease-related domain-containing protein [Chitinimonas taiwanensis DSM 18899]